jgi:hypothetical protein
MCDHGKDKKMKYLDIGLGEYFIYVCECGVLVDNNDPKNHNNPIIPMSHNELLDLVRRIRMSERHRIKKLI